MKPTRAAIASAVPLSELRRELLAWERLDLCHLCGDLADPAQLWREHDERDRPLPGVEHLLVVCTSKACAKVIDRHPRLYAREEGRPGHFPLLCGPCVHRRGAGCAHPDLKANGGAGLVVHLEDPLRGAIVCGRGGRITIPRRAIKCAGLRASEAES